MTEDGEIPWPPTVCPDCSVTVPAGEFCGACGAHLSSRTGSRLHAFAAHPHEHVFHPGVVSTLLPHVPHRHAAPFRLGLLFGTALLVVLAVTGATPAAIATGCLLVPLLYLIYLYEAEVYEDEPVLVIGATFVLGFIIGLPWARLTEGYITSTLVANAAGQATPSKLLIAGVVLPLVAQALMLAGPLALYARRRYDEALDGFTFGAACALGFVLAVNLMNLWPQISQGTVSGGSLVDNVLPIFARGLLIPFMSASTSGLIAGALWLHRGKTRSLAAHFWTTKLPAVTLTAACVWVFLGLVNITVTATTTAVLIYAATAAALLFAVRVALHHMLLSEAVEVTVGPEFVCLNCHYVVPRMAFCPHCGIATRATVKGGRPGLLRGFR